MKTGRQQQLNSITKQFVLLTWIYYPLRKVIAFALGVSINFSCKKISGSVRILASIVYTESIMRYTYRSTVMFMEDVGDMLEISG